MITFRRKQPNLTAEQRREHAKQTADFLAVQKALQSISAVNADPQLRRAVETVCRSAGVRW